MTTDPFGEALEHARTGISANRAYQLFREAGGSLRRSTFLHAFKEARESPESLPTDLGRPLDTRPRAAEIQLFETKTGTGYLQEVDVWVRDRDSGEVYRVPASLPTEDLMTRGDVMATVLDKYQANAEKYREQIIGATYSTTYLMAPASDIV